MKARSVKLNHTSCYLKALRGSYECLLEVGPPPIISGGCGSVHISISTQRRAPEGMLGGGGDGVVEGIYTPAAAESPLVFRGVQKF